MASRRHSRPPLELWGGTECTVSRVGEAYCDQTELSGHARRLEDLDLFAGLGIRAIRYPVLWERVAPDGLDRADWSWTDERLGRLRELGIRPIVGLVHHGSGPRHTSLLDPGFATGLAEFTAAVAERYPWADAWTPVNEPLTTARFSALYGHWYPHHRDHASFARALLNQCRAVVLAMREVRAVNPAAELVQTDDIGKCFSTSALAYQAALENERRWLTFDLLCGVLGPEAAMWNWLTDEASVDEGELAWFRENPCPPDVVGINHYLSSERFLDERLERYPPESHGGNGRDSYADVLAARVCADGAAGPRALLREAWDRYGIDLAITEVHNGCTREEQLRWLREVWDAAASLREEGVAVRAVTAWSLLGAHGWSELLTGKTFEYEPGVFDLRGPRPRPTALAGMLRALGAGEAYSHPVLDGPGWWRRDARLWYSPVCGEGRDTVARGDGHLRNGHVRPLLIVGARGTLGRAFARLCELRGIAYRLVSRAEMDIADARSVDAALALLDPWAVVNAAGYVRVDDAELEPAACFRENAEGPAATADACSRRGIPLLTFSSDLVFGGEKRAPYVESDEVAPLSVYGRSKALAEERVTAACPQALVIRTSAFFGPWDEFNFVTLALAALAAGDSFTAADDVVVSPTYVPDLVNTSLDLLIDGETGIWHLANEGALTWYELARDAAALAGVDSSRLEPRPVASFGLPARRPAYSALGSERGLLLRPLGDALLRYTQERLEPVAAAV